MNFVGSYYIGISTYMKVLLTYLLPWNLNFSVNNSISICGTLLPKITWQQTCFTIRTRPYLMLLGLCWTSLKFVQSVLNDCLFESDSDSKLPGLTVFTTLTAQIVHNHIHNVSCLPMFLRVHLSHTAICWDMSPFGNSRSYSNLILCYFEPTSIAEVEKGALWDH